MLDELSLDDLSLDKLVIYDLSKIDIIRRTASPIRGTSGNVYFTKFLLVSRRRRWRRRWLSVFLQVQGCET